MALRKPINIKKWIDENRHLLKPPVGNKVVWEDADFIIMVVGGPNSRKDFHYNESEEFFYQLEGNVIVNVQHEGNMVEVPINEGEIYLLPPKVPHNPVRGENTVGLVIELKRKENQQDGLLWFCEKCNHKLYDEYFKLNNIMTQFQDVFKRFYSSEELRTCKNCNHVMQSPK